MDCVQALGKLPLQLSASRIDFAVFSGHKLYAPKGVGMLFIRQGAPLTPLIVGGGQEQGMRSGTENMAGIAALGAVLAALNAGGTFLSQAALREVQTRIAQCLQSTFAGLVFNAPLEQCLPTTLNFSIPGVPSKTLIEAMDAAHLRVSGGSACSAAKAEPSFVLDAMGLTPWQSASAVRMSFGPSATETTKSWVDTVCQTIVKSEALLSQQLLADSRLHLTWNDIDAYLQQFANTQLIDVREAAEYAAQEPTRWGDLVAANVPLNEIYAQPQRWLPVDRNSQATVPLLLVCQSGQRSLKAAQFLDQLGHPSVRTLSGGLNFKAHFS